VSVSLARGCVLAASLALAGAGALAGQQADSLSGLRSGGAGRIQPGDRILLRVWREPDMSDTLTVDQNTEVVLPRLGPMSLVSHSVGSLQDTLRRRYAEFLRNPSIEVTVLRRIGVHGEVKNPDLYWVDVTMTLRDVIARAGGLTEIANRNDVVVVRGGEETKVRDWERGGPRASDLMSGDQIVVGRTSWLSRNALAAISTVAIVASIFVGVLR